MNVFLFLFTAALCFLLVPISERIAARVGALDYPGGRKIHTRVTPRLGGIAVFFAFAAALPFAVPLTDAHTAGLFTGGAILVAAGMTDDIRSLTPPVKLLFQCAAVAAALILSPPPEIYTLAGFRLPALAFPLSWIIGGAVLLLFINALNLIDGMDGLAGGIALISFLAFACVFVQNGDTHPASAALLLAACLCGFLPHNLYPAKTFLGDCGAQFLGFCVGIFALRGGGGGIAAERVLFLAVPIADLVFAFFRRVLAGKNPLTADKGHLHHRLRAAGLSYRGTVGVLLAVSLLCALTGLLFFS